MNACQGLSVSFGKKEAGHPPACLTGQQVQRRILNDPILRRDDVELIVKSQKRVFSLICWFVCSVGLVPIHASAVEASPTGAGAKIYAQRCAPCHGDDLVNMSGGWSFDLRRLRPDEHDRFVESVTTGKDNMPSWYGILSNEEIEAIWAYIRATVDK
jgi:cytochrome c5